MVFVYYTFPTRFPAHSGRGLPDFGKLVRVSGNSVFTTGHIIEAELRSVRILQLSVGTDEMYGAPLVLISHVYLLEVMAPNPRFISGMSKQGVASRLFWGTRDLLLL